MTAEDLLAHLRSLGIEVWADGDWLRYNAPKGALTPDLRAELTNHKSEILTLLRESNPDIKPAPPTLKSVSRDGEITMSSIQERLWFVNHLEPGLV